jgi:sialidase-1
MGLLGCKDALPALAVLAISAVALGQEGRWIEPRCTVLPFTKTGPFVELDDGRLMMVEGNATITTSDDGQTWSEPRPIYEGEGPGIPDRGQLIKTRSGVIILVYPDMSTFKWGWDNDTGKAAPDVQLDVWAIRSLDDGQTWVDRQMLLDGYCGALMDILETTSGHIVVPVQDLVRDPDRHAQYTFVSADEGKTWTRSNLVDIGGHGHHDGGCEATVQELTDGRLLMLIRTNLDRLWEAYSDDHGYHWREIRPSAIDASSSPAYLTRLRSGRLALAWNRLYPEGQDSFPRRAGQYSEVEASWHREELSIAFSEDDGATWTAPVVIAREKGAWLSYPYIFERRPGELWVFANQGKPPVAVRLFEADFVGQ